MFIDAVPINGDANELPTNYFNGGGPSSITTQTSPNGIPYLFGMWRGKSTKKKGDAPNGRPIQGNKKKVKNEAPTSNNVMKRD